MKSIFMLALAPVRKNKGQSFSLFLFALITALLLNIGLVLLFGMGSFFDERAELNRAAHFFGIYGSGVDSIDQGLDFMKNDSRVAETEKIQMIGGQGEYVINDNKAATFLMLSRALKEQKMEPPTLIGEYQPLDGNRIYIPYDIFLNGNFKVGDDFELTISGTVLKFKIAGATEEILFGSQMGYGYRLYIADEKFDELQKLLPNNAVTLLSARFHNPEDTLSFKTDYDKKVSTDGIVFSTSSYEGIKQNRLMTSTPIAVIIAAFAMILLFVSLMVIRFRIITGIEEGMINIGSQKAMGYINAQIISAIITQYGLITVVGSIIGSILAGFLLPVIATIFEPQIAMVWIPEFDIIITLTVVLLVFLAAAIIAFLTARKINKLHPIIALRGGMTSHSFRKNAFPLDKSRAPLDLLLSFKQIAYNKKQMFTLIFIIAAITMVSVVGITLNYSMNSKSGREAFLRTMFDEVSMCDAVFMLKSGDDGKAFMERLKKYPEIRKVLAYQADGMTFQADEISVMIQITEDFSQLESRMLVKGHYPKHDNEIVLSSLVLQAAGKEIGDTVTIRNEDIEKDYIVTGIVQSIGNTNWGAVTTPGIRALSSGFMFTHFFAYANEGTDIEAVIEAIQKAEGDIFESIVNIKEVIDLTLDGIGTMFQAAAYGIMAVTVFVVILTLYMIIKAAILKRKREFGIQKAVGFTTFQLMNQIALNMTPAILFGVLAGAVAGYLGFNPLLAGLMGGAGIARVELPSPLGQIMVVCAALVILAYSISMLIAWRIRKISAYALVSE